MDIGATMISRKTMTHQRSEPTAKRSPAAASSSRTASVLGLISGAIGVGRTNLTLNLGIRLAQLGYRATVVDADRGAVRPFDDVRGLEPLCALGTSPESISRRLVRGPGGVHVFPRQPEANPPDAHYPATTRASLAAALGALAARSDFLLLDCDAGFSRLVEWQLSVCDRILVVVTPDPAHLTTTYAMLKQLRELGAMDHAEWFLVASCGAPLALAEAQQRFQQTAQRFLGLKLTNLPVIPRDQAIVNATRARHAVMTRFARSPGAQAMRAIADYLAADRRSAHRFASTSLAQRRDLWSTVASLFL